MFEKQFAFISLTDRKVYSLTMIPLAMVRSKNGLRTESPEPQVGFGPTA